MTTDPHSTELEQATLGGLLLEPDSIVDVLGRMQPQDLYDPVHRDIFSAMVELYEEHGTFDLLTLSDRLAASPRVQAASGSAYLAELATRVPTAANIQQHAQRIKDKAVHRALIAAGQDLVRLGRDEQLDATEIVDRAERAMLAVSKTTTASDPATAATIADRLRDAYRASTQNPAEDRTVCTGFVDLDRKLGPLHPGNLVIIAARPSLGKTSLAITIADHAALRAEKTVALFSLEMEDHEIIDRRLAAQLGTSKLAELKEGKLSHQETDQAFDRIRTERFFIDDGMDRSIPSIRSKAHRLAMKYGLDLVIVDYLQLVEVTDPRARENRVQEVSYVSRQLKALARELHCPVIALSQLSRKTEERARAIPQLSDLRDSGAIEQDADKVLMLYREEVYNEDCAHPGVTDVYIRKNRSGETGSVELFFDPQRVTFVSLAHDARRKPP